MKFTSEKVNELLGVDEAFKVPNKLMSIMMNREEREQTFKSFLEVECDTSFDWFHEYFESEQSERKTKKQDFTPDSVSDIMTKLVGKSDIYFESAAGTGGIAIRHWWHDLIDNHDPFLYEPSDDYMVLEEKSERVIMTSAMIFMSFYTEEISDESKSNTCCYKRYMQYVRKRL